MGLSKALNHVSAPQKNTYQVVLSSVLEAPWMMHPCQYQDQLLHDNPQISAKRLAA